MKNTSFNTKKTDSRLNSTTVIVLVIAALPILLFALTKMFPPTADAPAKETNMSETKATRLSAAERRAQRAEERKAKRAEKVTTASTQFGGMPADPGMMNFPAPMEPMEFNVPNLYFCGVHSTMGDGFPSGYITGDRTGKKVVKDLRKEGK